MRFGDGTSRAVTTVISRQGTSPSNRMSRMRPAWPGCAGGAVQHARQRHVVDVHRRASDFGAAFCAGRADR